MQAPHDNRFRFSRGVASLALLGYSAWLVFPMVWVGYSSLKRDEAIFLAPFALPSAGSMAADNYAHAWRQAHFGEYFLNSVAVTGASVALIVALGVFFFFSLARLNLKCLCC